MQLSVSQCNFVSHKFTTFCHSYLTMYFSKSHFQPQGKCALIVGASQGLGAELARQLYSKGCTVILVARTQAKLKLVVDEIEKEKIETGDPKALYIAADVSKYDQCLQLWQEIDEAGLAPFASFLKILQAQIWLKE